jgi:hypothetical protein
MKEKEDEEMERHGHERRSSKEETEIKEEENGCWATGQVT